MTITSKILNFKIRRFFRHEHNNINISFIFLYLIDCIKIWGTASAINIDSLIKKKIKNYSSKLISDPFQTINNYHSYRTRSFQSLQTLISRNEATYKTFTYIGSLA